VSLIPSDLHCSRNLPLNSTPQSQCTVLMLCPSGSATSWTKIWKASAVSSSVFIGKSNGMREASSVNITALWQPPYDFTGCFPHTSALTISSRVPERGRSDGGWLPFLLSPTAQTLQSPEMSVVSLSASWGGVLIPNFRVPFLVAVDVPHEPMMRTEQSTES